MTEISWTDRTRNAVSVRLPSGARLYWEGNTAGGRTYWSDEIGDGVIVWDTSAVSRATIEAALRLEAEEDAKWQTGIQKNR